MLNMDQISLVFIILNVITQFQGITGQTVLNISPSTTATVTENDDTTLTCTYSSGGVCPSSFLFEWWKNGTKKLSIAWNNANCFFADGDNSLQFNCNSTENACVLSLTLNRVKNAQHGDRWQCLTGGVFSIKTSIFIQVPIKNVSLTSPATSQVSVVENLPYSFLCETSAGRPQATVQWYTRRTGYPEESILGGTITTKLSGTLIITKSTMKHTAIKSDGRHTIYCKASNAGSAVLTSTQKPAVNVLYAPVINDLLDRSVVVSSPLTAECIIIPGNPSDTAYKWTRSSDSWSQDGKSMTLAVVTKGDAGDYTCTATNLMTPTGEDSVNGEDRKTFTLTVYYAPVTADLQNRDVVVKRSLSVQCTATSGDPPHTSYRWTRSKDSWVQTGQTLSILSVQKTDADVYTCTARNVMTPTDGAVVKGEDSSTFILNVLYSPVIGIMSDRSVVLSSPLTVQCDTTPGNPPQTSYLWTRSTDNWSQNGLTLNITSVEKTDAGEYTCTAWNTMIPTEGSRENGEDKKTFAVDVLYETSITSFIISEKSGSSIYTVDENSTKTFQCQIDSNPSSAIIIRKLGGSQLVFQSSTHFVTFTKTLGCHDAGKYACTGYNSYNGDERPTKELQLFVRCAPRPLKDIEEIITIHETLYSKTTLSLVVTAYPTPTFTWFVESNCNGSGWTQIYTGISSDEATSNMTIKRLQQTDLGQYKLEVSNGITPDFVQLFTISVLEEQPEQFTKPCTDQKVTVLVGATTASFLFGVAFTIGMLFLLRYFEIVRFEKRNNYSENTASSPKQFEKGITDSYDDSGETNAVNEEDEIHQYEGLVDTNSPAHAYEAIGMEPLPTSPETTRGVDNEKTYINIVDS